MCLWTNMDKLKEIENYARQNHIPIVLPETATFITDFCKKNLPKRILELGTAIGYSGALMLLASPESSLITIERDAERITKAKETFKLFNLENRVKIIDADATEFIKTLDEKFDLIFLDANKSKYFEQLPYLINLMSENGTLIADNIMFHGMVLNNEYPKHKHRTSILNMRKFITLAEKSLKNYQLLPIGDGIIIGNKKSD